MGRQPQSRLSVESKGMGALGQKDTPGAGAMV